MTPLQPPKGAGSFAETMFKRLWHRGFKGHFAAFHWDTYWNGGWQWLPVAGGAISASLARYNDSEHIAWTEAAPALKAFVDSLPHGTKNIAAHSMGNIVTGEALRLGMGVNNYALMQPAVPAACYDSRTEVKQTNSYTHYGFFTMWNTCTPDGDSDQATRDLAYRGRLANVSGNLVNFCLEADYATSVAWEINNSIKKPPSELVVNFFYAPSANPGEKLRRYNSAGHLEYFITNSHEAMSYACRTWGKAAGAWLPTAGAINTNATVNLGLPTYQLPGESQNSGFGDEHSGQFNASIQSLKPFYDALMRRLGLGDPNP